MAGGIAFAILIAVIGGLLIRAVVRANPFKSERPLFPRDYGETPRIPDEMKHSEGGYRP